MEKSKLKNLVKLLLVLLGLTIGFYVVKSIIDCVELYNCLECSTPWYTALLSNSIIFIIPILLEVALFIYFYKRSKI